MLESTIEALLHQDFTVEVTLVYLCSCLETDVMKRDKPEPRSVNLSKTVYRSLHVFVGDGGQSCVVDVLQPPCSAQTVISV